MSELLRNSLPTLVCSVCCGLALLMTGAVDAMAAPPNWKVAGIGSTAPAEDGTGRDIDDFSGVSSHLGRFTGEGAHLLNPATGYFEGHADYTAANGDLLYVDYAGFITGIDLSQAFPFQFEANVQIVGGTGRLQQATGGGVMTGAFSGVPGELYFFIEGTLDPR